MPAVAAASSQPREWTLRDRDLKTYLHFGRKFTREQLEELALDPSAVARHAFFPLFLYEEKWIKFRGSGRGKVKTRPIRYAARRDAAIYACYRHKLAVAYERELKRRRISHVPIAYRQIKRADGRGRKSNIEFAKDLFDAIRNIGDCYVTVLDISSYFESLDHSAIRRNWELLIGGPLSPDHEAVFRSITRYCTVDKEKVFERLGLYDRSGSGNRIARRRRRIDALRLQRRVQVADAYTIRQKIFGGDSTLPSLIQKNNKDYGIPQGTPISDVIANFYLLDFDEQVDRWVAARGGVYFRYCDDLVVVTPKAVSASPEEAKIFLQSEIARHGQKLRIQDRKVATAEFFLDQGGLRYRHHSGSASKNGLEYLGFEFDGRVVEIKDSTLSNAWRKMRRRAWGSARRFVRHYRLKGDLWCTINFPLRNIEKTLLSKVTYSQDTGFGSWTFVKYVRRASAVFSDYDRKFSRQTRRYRRLTQAVLNICLNKAIEKYGMNGSHYKTR